MSRRAETSWRTWARRSPRSTPASSREGFSLAELLLAIAILGLVSLGASALLGALAGGSAGTRDDMTAHLLAVERMEGALRAGFESLEPGTDVESPVGGFDRFTARTVVSEESNDLRRVRVVVESTLGADSLETLVGRKK